LVAVVAVSLGVMKTAAVDTSSYARLAAVHPLAGMGEVADGIFCQERAGFVTGEILHIDGGMAPML
jgi:NAD(P)-dependent dehydrogenase (short-subunit alcohol dehydrogenase family)